MDYNRVVKDLNGLSPDEFIEKLKADFEIQEAERAVAPQALHEFGMYLKNKWYKLVARPGTYCEDPIGVLDNRPAYR